MGTNIDFNKRQITENNVKPNLGILNNFDESTRLNTNMPPEQIMEKLMAERNTINNNQQSNYELPEYMKPKDSQPVVEKFTNYKLNDNINNINNDSKMQGDTYHLSGSNLDSQFSNINFFDNELSLGLPDVDESVDTNKRLEILQNERTNLSNNINTPDDNFIKPDFSKSIEDNNNLINSANKINNGNIVEKLNNVNRDDVLRILNNYANSNNSMTLPEKKVDINENIEKKDDKITEFLSELGRKQLDQLKQVQLLQEQLQNHIKSQLLNPVRSNEVEEGMDELKNELISKVKILTGQLEQVKKINIQLKKKIDDLMNENTN